MIKQVKAYLATIGTLGGGGITTLRTAGGLLYVSCTKLSCGEFLTTVMDSKGPNGDSRFFKFQSADPFPVLRMLGALSLIPYRVTLANGKNWVEHGPPNFAENMLGAMFAVDCGTDYSAVVLIHKLPF